MTELNNGQIDYHVQQYLFQRCVFPYHLITKRSKNNV